MRHISESIIGKRGSGFFNSKSDLRQGDIVYLRHDKSIPYMYISDQGIISALFLGSSNYKYERRDGIFVYAYDNEYGIRVYYLSEYNDNLDYNNYIKDNLEKSSKKNKKDKNKKKGKKTEKDDNKLTADFLLNNIGIGDGEEENEESKSKSKSKEESSEEKNNKNDESNDYLNYDSNYSDNNYKKGNDDHFSLCDD